MKLILALLVWLGFAACLAIGLVWAVQGRSLWLLLVALILFGVGLARFGCRSH